MADRVVEMDVMCELASDITEYIWLNVLHKTTAHSFIDSKFDPDTEHYVEEAQDIFNEVLDKIDSTINGEEVSNE